MAQNFNVETKKKDDKKKAVALVYEPGNEAPQVVASGKGVIAERIIDTAKKSDVPLYKDTDLTNTLLNLDIGECIPPELFINAYFLLIQIKKCHLRDLPYLRAGDCL